MNANGRKPDWVTVALEAAAFVIGVILRWRKQY